VDVEDRAEWRRRTRVADPHQRDLQSEGEREASVVSSRPICVVSGGGLLMTVKT